MSFFRNILVALAALIAVPHPAAAQALTVMSFNVRYPSPNDGADVWANRRDHLVDTIRATAPDIIGTQELFAHQGQFIVDQLPAYGWFGTDRRGGHDDEHMGIFYRRDRLKLVEMGQFWLSDTPGLPGSISWGHPYPRMVTWGVFETRDGRRFRMLNTHFPYRGEDEPARTRAATLIAARLAAFDDGLPVVLTGDFNAGPDSPAHAILTRDLADTWRAAPSRAGPEGTFHGFTGTPSKRIDWVLARGFDVAAVRSIATPRRGRYPSDHFPVVATLRWPAPLR